MADYIEFVSNYSDHSTDVLTDSSGVHSKVFDSKGQNLILPDFSVGIVFNW